MRRLTTLVALILSLVSLSLFAQTSTPPPFATHRNLDWSAASRWVHIDNVDPAQETLFVNSRHRWLKDLTQGDSILGDGRPLFWCASTDTSRTFYTFYPFKVWADLDARAAMATQTNKLVGEDKLKAYDAGDAALVPPHGSQFWRRVVSADIVSPAADSLTELTARVGRMEFRLVDWSNWDQYEKVYAEFREALLAQNYPLTGRVFSNSYGGKQGEYLLWWLARDSSQYEAAPSIRAALEKGLGKAKADDLLTRLDKYFPVQHSAAAKRRDDMSNLGR